MNTLKLIQNILLLAIMMSGARWIGIFIHYQYFPSTYDILMNIWMGLRFDLLVISFLLFPLWLFFIFNLRRKSAYIQYLDFGLLLVWIFISGVYFFNFLHLNTHQDLVWSQDWLSATHLLLKVSALEIVGSLLLAFLVFVVGYFLSQKIRRNILAAHWRSRIVLFLILAFFARGSLGQDHLRRNDCDGRANSVVRALCLNPVYVFSKVKNQEFGP
jgi:hypothetical protein